MTNIFNKLKNRIQQIRYRRYFYLSKIYPRQVPASALHYLPDNFTVQKIANTGLRVVENFCTRNEADLLVEMARSQLTKSQVVVDGKVVNHSGRTSTFAMAFHKYHQDSRVLPIIARGAMLAGVPVDHAEPVYVTRYSNGEYYKGHFDFGDSFFTEHRLYTMLIYLNDLSPEQGGATYFRDLNIAVQPKAGRAVIWTNMNPDGSTHSETVHAALPPKGDDVEKWVIQLWFRPYRLSPVHEKLKALQSIPGERLKGDETLPSGTWIPSFAKGANQAYPDNFPAGGK
jgi:prolyl 4-hydroxylase